MLSFIYHTSFDDIVLIYDSNWYIKCINNIEIDKKKMGYFGPLSQYITYILWFLLKYLITMMSPEIPDYYNFSWSTWLLWCILKYLITIISPEVFDYYNLAGSISLQWFLLKYLIIVMYSEVPDYSVFSLEAGVIWYFQPHGKLTTGSIFIQDILNPLLKTDPCMVNLIPPSPISNQEICREVKILCVVGSIFHG